MGIFLLFLFISYAYICTCIGRHLKETIPSSSITWSEMGKQIIQAKEVYCVLGNLEPRAFPLGRGQAENS